MKSFWTGEKDSTNSRCMAETWRNRMSGLFRLFVKEPLWYRRYRSFLLCRRKRLSVQVLSRKQPNLCFSTNTLAEFRVDRALHDLMSPLGLFRILRRSHSHSSWPIYVADPSLIL